MEGDITDGGGEGSVWVCLSSPITGNLSPGLTACWLSTMVARLDIKLRLLVGLCLFCSLVLSKKSTKPLLEKVMMDISKNYDKYANLEGEKDAMSVTEFEAFIKDHFPRLLVGKRLDTVERMLASIDDDQDGQLTYKEYLNFIMQFILASNNSQRRM